MANALRVDVPVALDEHLTHGVSMADVDRATQLSDSECQVVLFTALATRMAAARARAAELLLARYAGVVPHGSGLAREFGAHPEAVLSSAMDELRRSIGIPASLAWQRFAASMRVDFDAWHDGTGYDIDAIAGLSAAERGMLREVMRSRLTNALRPAEWRDMETAAALGDWPVLERIAESDDVEVRLRALRLLGDMDAAGDLVVSLLTGDSHERALFAAFDLVSQYRTTAVRNALIERVRRVDAYFIVAAMTLLENFCGCEDPWNERPALFEMQDEGVSSAKLRLLLARCGGESGTQLPGE
ncbi:MAG: hypothetical protein MNPFHGCM_02604 [Gemmatimonadaceae bacterium]|nr:hypothetical protein [Gemmatimonadaceae bacterium]